MAEPRMVDPHDPVHPHLARATPGVPGPTADVDPLRATTPPGVPVVVRARQLEREQPGSVVPDEEDRPVLALPVVLLERHPRPDDLPRVGPPVGMRGVDGVERPGVVTRVRRGLRADRQQPPEETPEQAGAGAGW